MGRLTRRIGDKVIDVSSEFFSLTHKELVHELFKRLAEYEDKDEPKQVIIKQWSPAYCPTCNKELSTSEGDGYYSHPDFLERCPNMDCCQRLKW